MFPTSGDVLRVTRAASVQFHKPMMFRVIRVLDWNTYDGWAWLEGYQLNSAGDAVERREIFVQLNGLQPAASRGNRAPTVARGDQAPIVARGDRAPTMPHHRASAVAR